MEALFKKQFWVINLMFLAGNAFLLARASNQFVGHFLAQQLTNAASSAEPARPHAHRPPPQKQIRDLGDEKNNMFGAVSENLEALAAAAAAAEAPPPPVSDASAVPTVLRIKLSGVTWYENPEWSQASIIDLGTQESGLYSSNPCPPANPDGADLARRFPCNLLLADNTIVEIQPKRVVFINKAQNRREFIDMDDEAMKPPEVGAMSAPTPPEQPPPPAEGLGKGIQKVADNQYRIPQADVDEVLANLNSVATQARIVPSFEGGKANGFKLFSIRPNSIYAKIGIQNGDVINRINGYEITSPDKALEVYSKLKDAKEISVDLTRRGQKQSMSYAIQ